MSDHMNGSPPAVEVEARQLGWVPKDEWRGDPERWTDAEAFVNRGHEVLPILKANNRRLVEQAERQAQEIAELRRLHKESQESIEQLKTFSTQFTKDRVEEAKKKVLADLKVAKEAGDSGLEVDLLDQLTDLKAMEKEQKAAPTPAPAPKQDDAVDPAFVAWTQDPANAWFGTDRRKTSVAVEIARELRADPKNSGLVGLAFFNLVGKETAKYLGEGETPPAASKVEGSRGGSGGSSSSSSKAKTYNDLPADAKAACDKQGRNFIGKAGYKTEADWRNYYCSLYFAGDEA